MTSKETKQTENIFPLKFSLFECDWGIYTFFLMRCLHWVCTKYLKIHWDKLPQKLANNFHGPFEKNREPVATLTLFWRDKESNNVMLNWHVGPLKL